MTASASTMTASTTPTAQNNRPLYRATAALLIIEFALIFVPLGVLGAAINWPASLDEPASVNLPLIVEQAGAVQFGYFVYLIYSILFWPLSLLMVRVIAGRDQYGPLLQLAAGFGIASAVLRCLGIIRWLVPMPVLAQTYVDPATSEATREAITVVYQMLNDYAGSVGELLGVSFFAALWLVIVSVVILRDASLPRWLGVYGLVAAGILLVLIIELFGIDSGPLITISGVVLHFWFLAAGIVLLRKKTA